MHPGKHLLVATGMAFHDGEPELLFAVFAAHGIDGVGIEHLERVFACVIAMRTEYLQNRHDHLLPESPHGVGQG